MGNLLDQQKGYARYKYICMPDAVDEVGQILLRFPTKSLHPVSQQISISFCTAIKDYCSDLSEYP
jgi:hypothetical protein